MQFFPLYLLLLILPLAVAGQNIGSGVVAAILFGMIYGRRRELPVAEWRAYRVPLILSLLYLAFMMVSTLANPANPDRYSGTFIFGHLTWALLPAVAFLALPPIPVKDWRRLGVCLAFVSLVMAGVALSQNIIGWRIVGSAFVFGPTRAQGFYSHPLTFAYVAIIIFPAASVWVARQPKNAAAWLTALGMLIVIVASRSRIVQVVGLAAVLFNAAVYLRGKTRVLAFAIAVTICAGIAATDNPIRRRFVEGITGADTRSDYADDRLAFWQANFDMWKERPLLGHGEGLGTEYRRPYYEALGLGHFERIYEAHNQYLQVAVNGGVVALILFLAWYAWYLRKSWRDRRSLGGAMALQALVFFALAAITQNAFQDSEVRYTLTLLCTALWLRVT